MVFGKLQLYLIMGLLLVGLTGAAYFYYTDTQNKLITAAEQNAAYLAKTALQEVTIKQLNADVSRSNNLLAQLQNEFADFRRDYNALEKKFSKVSKNFGTRDIGKLAERKPNLIAKVINNATKNALRCFEVLAGAPLTEAELNANKRSEYNAECPSIHPNYSPDN
jgi:uncharacterized coiled-coil protein SlyX